MRAGLSSTIFKKTVFLIFWKNETISMFLEIFEMVMEFKFVRFQYFLLE